MKKSKNRLQITITKKKTKQLKSKKKYTNNFKNKKVNKSIKYGGAQIENNGVNVQLYKKAFELVNMNPNDRLQALSAMNQNERIKILSILKPSEKEIPPKISKNCLDYKQCCPQKYEQNDITEIPMPIFDVGDDVIVVCPGGIGVDGNFESIEKKGKIISIKDAFDKIVHDQYCGRHNKWPQEFRMQNCDCCLDRPYFEDSEICSVWYLPDQQRKYFVEYDDMDNYIDLVFEHNIYR